MAVQLHCVIEKRLQYRGKKELFPIRSTRSVSQGTEVTFVTEYVFNVLEVICTKTYVRTSMIKIVSLQLSESSNVEIVPLFK